MINVKEAILAIVLGMAFSLLIHAIIDSNKEDPEP
mgnify:FL=1